MSLISRSCEEKINSNSSMPSFRDPQIQNYCRRRLDDFKIDTLTEEGARPLKRARLSFQQEENTHFDARVHVISNINSLVGVQGSTELIGLSHISV